MSPAPDSWTRVKCPANIVFIRMPSRESVLRYVITRVEEKEEYFYPFLSYNDATH